MRRLTIALVVTTLGAGCHATTQRTTPVPEPIGVSTIAASDSTPAVTSSTMIGEVTSMPGVTATPGQPMDNPVAIPSSTAYTPGPDNRPDLPHGKIGRPRGQKIDPATATKGTADQVATAFAVTLSLWDSTIDVTPNDAGRRGRTLASKSLAQSLTSASSKASPGHEWFLMAQHQGYTIVTKTTLGGLGESPVDTPTQAVRAVTVSGQYRGMKDWAAPFGPTTYLLHLTKEDGRWVVSTMEVLA